MTPNRANVTRFLFDGKDPGAVALRTIADDYTYGDLQSASLAVARYLVRAGTRKGDRILLLADNSLFWVAAYLGILRAGLMCVPVPTTLTAAELAYIIGLTEARFAFAQARFCASDPLKKLNVVSDRQSPNLSAVTTLQNLQTGSDHDSDIANTTEPSDLAALMFTSGSTGKPRGVMVSHHNIIANTESIIQYLYLTEHDRIMTVLPFHYCFGTSLLHTHLSVGASLVVDPRFMYPETILDRMIEAKCTGFAGVPSHFQILLRKSSLRKRKFPDLRYVQQAGGHLAPSFVQELRHALPHVQVFVMYGQTEATARLSYVPPDDLDRKLGSIGKAIPGVTLRVMDELGNRTLPGQAGELVAEGANITQGYWREPEESAKYFRNGKLYTGDLGTVDEEGFLYVLDRAKDFIKCGGKRVSCRHIEEELLQLDDLLEVAVIGVADDVLGEAVKAFVVPRTTPADDLKERILLFCREHLGQQLLPKEIVLMKSLPKNSSGKILKRELTTAQPDFPDITVAATHDARV